jgi:hypothetical protein
MWGKRAVSEIEKLLLTVDDTLEMESYFDKLASDYGMEWIRFECLCDKEAKIKFKINPEFEIGLNGTNLEMRSEGTGKGSAGAALQTAVKWKTDSLKLDGKGPYTVGTCMHAFPLSADHPPGTVSKADTEHKKWMDLLPSSTTHKGDKANQFIRGHLLNDNLGGPAKKENLFPITGYSNGQHEQNAERFIKGGIKNGYVYEYLVEIKNVAEGTTSTYHTVKCDLDFKFSRLDAANNPLKTHKGTIKSEFGQRHPDPYDKKKEMGSEHSTFNSKALAIPLGLESTNTVTKENEKLTTNNQLDIDELGKKSFTLTGPTGGSFTPSVSIAPGQSINPLPTYSKKLSLRKSSLKEVQDKYTDLVIGWKGSEIKDWIKELNSSNITKWDNVEQEAIDEGKLDKKIAKQIFKANGEGRSKTTINGKP